MAVENDKSDEDSLKLLTGGMKFSEEESEKPVPEEEETAADEAAETPAQQAEEAAAGTEKHEAHKAEGKESEIAQLRKMVEELLNSQKSQARSPEHAAFAKAYPHLTDKYSELADKASQFANDAVGEDHPNWVNVAERFLKHSCDSYPKEEKKEPLVAKQPVSGAKNPKGTSVVSKPKPTAKPKDGTLTEDEEIRLLTPSKY